MHTHIEQFPYVFEVYFIVQQDVEMFEISGVHGGQLASAVTYLRWVVDASDSALLASSFHDSTSSSTAISAKHIISPPINVPELS